MKNINDKMYANIGGKIKTLASVLCWAGIIISCLFGLITLAFGGIFIAAIGSLMSWISSFVLYGFGQIIENTDKLVTAAKSEPAEQTPIS